jgi:thiamine pyrophosphokinase
LVNLALARRFGVDLGLILVEMGMAVLLGPGRHRLPLKRGRIFSVLAAADAARVSISGARYPLRRERLLPGSRGLSNRALGPITIFVHSGLAWAMAPEAFAFS